MPFQQMLRETKTKSKKFGIRWSEVPRVLEPLKSSYGHFSHLAGHGRGIQAEKHPKWQKIAISRGYVHFQEMLRDKNEEQEIPHPMVRSAARSGAPKIELWPF